MDEPTIETGTPGAAPRRRRAGLKRTKFQVPPRMPLPVRGLWQAATEADRARAHATAVAILEAWLGKVTREEAAARLEIPRLRFWQLSQQAVAGMVAGLLRQPQARRGRPRAEATPPEEDPRWLRRRIEGLESELSGARSLIAILRDLPAHREAATPTTEPRDARRPAGAREAAPARREKASRPVPADVRGANGGGTRAAREVAPRDAANPSDVGGDGGRR